MFSSSSPVALSAHKDVLEALVPDDPSQRASLLEELKNRGKGAVVAQQWPDAVALYQKGLDVAATDNEKAILNSNIALAQGKMGKWKESLETSQEAVRLDATYLKGWFRLGQSQSVLGNHKQAIEALEKALKIEPNNKALLKELEKVQKAAQTAKETKPVEKVVEKAEPLKKTPAKKTSKPKVDSEATAMDVDDEANFTASDHVKGYKIVNGKKTSYFHNELSEDAAKLIGNIAPQKIDGPIVEEAPATGASAWNKAGTWEEKDCTNWAKESLEKIMLETSTSEWKITKANVDSGHASVAMVRGKKRYIFEMEKVVLDWDFDDGMASGTVRMVGFDGTDEDYDFLEFNVNENDDLALRDRLKKPSSQTGLRQAIQQSITSWVELFHNTF